MNSILKNRKKDSPKTRTKMQINANFLAKGLQNRTKRPIMVRIVNGLKQTALTAG